jgi:hypothetical protein
MANQDAQRWWRNLSGSAPASVVGLWFGLVELADGGWHIYVAGTAEFDGADETAEWAVGPYVWWPDGRYFPFPAAGGDSDIASAVEAAAAFVEDLAPWTAVPVQGIATGFDDGDFKVVYQR